MQGFSFDDGGNIPLGKQSYVELIKTPQELAQIQSERFYEEDLILSNVLRGADLIVTILDFINHLDKNNHSLRD